MPVPTTPSATPKVLLRDSAYAQILDAIIDGTLTPGEVLRESELQQWLGVSRTPIREALLSLQHARLIRAEPGRLTCVSPLDAHAAWQTQGVIGHMYQLAAAAGVDRISTAELNEAADAAQEFRAAATAGDEGRLFGSVDVLRNVLFRASGNIVALCVVEQFGPLLRREERARFDPGLARAVDHGPLLSALTSGDGPAAVVACAHLWGITSPPPTPPGASHGDGDFGSGGYGLRLLGPGRAQRTDG